LITIQAAFAEHDDILEGERREEVGGSRLAQACASFQQQRVARETFRQQQEADYAHALAADKQMQNDREREQTAAIERERAEVERADAEAAARASSLASVPRADDTDTSASTLRLRLPNGQLLEHRFAQHHLLRDVFALVTGHGFPATSYRLLTSDFPKRDVSGRVHARTANCILFQLSAMSPSLTLAEVKLSKREQITIDPK
jgi:hypothetical protein